MFDGLREKKRRNIYAVIMIALLVLTAISANIIAAVILVIMFLLYALSMLSTLYMGEQGVTVTMDVPGETEQGRSVDLTLAVRGARPWYLANLSSHITIQNELTGETMEVNPSFFLLPPGTGRCRPVTISDTHCGRIRITADPVSFTDLLDRVKRDSGTSYETFLYCFRTWNCCLNVHCKWTMGLRRTREIVIREAGKRREDEREKQARKEGDVLPLFSPWEPWTGVCPLKKRAAGFRSFCLLPSPGCRRGGPTSWYGRMGRRIFRCMRRSGAGKTWTGPSGICWTLPSPRARGNSPGTGRIPESLRTWRDEKGLE